jgi:hypothetical protein
MFRSKEAIKLLPPPLSHSSVLCFTNHTAVPAPFPLHLCSVSLPYQRLTKTYQMICLTGTGGVLRAILYHLYSRCASYIQSALYLLGGMI